MPAKICPPTYASCPGDGKILRYYEGQFDSAYVLLHPFIQPISIPLEQFMPGTWPSKAEIISACAAVTWESIIESVGFDHLGELDIALRTTIHGLERSVERVDLAESLYQHLETHRPVQPEEGDIPPLLENRLLSAFRKLGHESLLVGNDRFALATTHRQTNQCNEHLTLDSGVGRLRSSS